MPIDLLMPALSPTMTDGTLARWLKKEGDPIKPGEVIAEIETDKATMEVESIDTGTIGKILIAEGTNNVPVNSCIAVLLGTGESKEALANYTPKTLPTKTEAKPTPPIAQAPTAATLAPAPTFAAPPKTLASSNTASAKTSGRSKASPLAKRLAHRSGLDLETLEGTGPKGRIVKDDIEHALKYGNTQSIRRNSTESIAIPNSTMRKVIAKRLLESKQWVPHFYLTIHCRIDKLLELRKDLNHFAPSDEAGEPRYKISVNDMIVKASALALKAVPEANATWTDEAILRYQNVDVAVAVALDGGLITPIVRNADQKNLPLLSSELRDLISRARKNKLAPEEFQGGGFSISNLGMYDISAFSAIINPPQSCILAVGAGEERAIIADGSLTKATMMTVTLSADHRVVDGAVGAELLSAFKRHIEHPVSLV